MAFPWKMLGKLALGFAEYALEQRMKPAAPTEKVQPEAPAPVAPSAPAVPDAPAPIAPTVDWRDTWVFEQYRKAPPDGMNRYPDDTEWRSDSENVGKYGRDWLVKKLRERNGVKE